MPQALTNCMHGYDCACNVHANGVMLHKNLCTVLIPLCKNNLNFPDRPLCFKKIRTTTTTTFLISNTIVSNPYSHSTAFDPQSFTSLS